LTFAGFYNLPKDIFELLPPSLHGCSLFTIENLGVTTLGFALLVHVFLVEEYMGPLASETL
jgi:hypothetical protein